jgi:threonyl-tRNA synthetase
MARVTFPDGSAREYADGTLAREIAADLGAGLAKAALVAKVNDELVDLSRPVTGDVRLTILTNRDAGALEVLRHSAAHVLAAAVCALYRDVKLGFGPAVEDGFYYDFDLTERLTDADLARIEAKMREIVSTGESFRREKVSAETARREMEVRGQAYKLEYLQELEGQTISLYRTGEFVDVCAGPHVPDTGRVGTAFKLLSVAGAYWRADSSRQMLQRVYGTAFFKQADLDLHLERLEQAKLRDHRRLGKELDLFSIHEEIGPGLAHWHPKGAIVRDVIEALWKERHRAAGYQLVATPHIASERIYEISGHLQTYTDLMYAPMEIEGRPYRVKPMNCPGHLMIYKTRIHSYRELPIRYAEMGAVYRFEKSGVLQGLLRVRGFTIDDAHIICTAEQLESEVVGAFRFSLEFLRLFGFTEYQVYLATRPEKSVGTDEGWTTAIATLRAALEHAGIAYEVDEGGGAFYGPKIDLKVKDCLGRAWQCTTIQFDFNLPERFDITYMNERNELVRPYIVHRALLGSLERFFALLVEQYAGAFPVWLAPVQARVLTLTDDVVGYGEEVLSALRSAGFRAEGDFRPEKVNAKVRQAEVEKVPYMFVVGKREAGAGSVAVRRHGVGDLGPHPLAAALDRLRAEAESRALGPTEKR